MRVTVKLPVGMQGHGITGEGVGGGKWTGVWVPERASPVGARQKVERFMSRPYVLVETTIW